MLKDFLSIFICRYLSQFLFDYITNETHPPPPKNANVARPENLVKNSYVRAQTKVNQIDKNKRESLTREETLDFDDPLQQKVPL